MTEEKGAYDFMDTNEDSMDLETVPDVGTLEPEGWKYTNNAMVFSRNPTWDEAEDIAAALTKMNMASGAWVGDAALRFSLLWPDVHYQLWDDRYAGKTVLNRMIEAKKIPPPRRRELSAGVISAICGLDTEEDQDTAIEIADRDGLTVAEVRELVKTMKGTPPKPEKVYRIPCIHCGAEMEITESELRGSHEAARPVPIKV
uniref:Uncharacterized protein n=1 Tax=viral metagenome TaxID=1070528 RepID=A0A6M3LNJ0_9ZZZZ